jgi:hypothetical protein
VFFYQKLFILLENSLFVMGVHIAHRQRIVTGGRHRSIRPKTFTSEEAANKYAELNKISGYELVNLKSEDSLTKKFRIVPKK